MNKDIRTVEILTKKNRPFKIPRFRKVTEYIFCDEIWNQIKEYLIIFNPKFHFYNYSFSESIMEDDTDEYNFNEIIRTISFGVFDFTKFNQNSKYHLILQNTEDVTSNNQIIKYPSKLEFVSKESNDINLQLGFISHKCYSQNDYTMYQLNTANIDLRLDELNTDNKIKWEFTQWKENIKDKVDYHILDRFLELNKHHDKLIIVEKYLRELLNNKYKIRKIFKPKRVF
jgi:hypothetical protein